MPALAVAAVRAYVLVRVHALFTAAASAQLLTAAIAQLVFVYT